MIFDWFDTREAEIVGLKLADIVSSELEEKNKKVKKNKKKEIAEKAKIMQKVFTQANQYKQNSNPNFYKKAKLANVFKWRLLELEHDAEFVNILTRELVLHMK